MDLSHARGAIGSIAPVPLSKAHFVRAWNSRSATFFGCRRFFDSRWSFERGYRYNFRKTHPVLYLAADHLVASLEIGPRLRPEVLAPHLQAPRDPYVYLTVEATASVLDLTDRSTRRRIGVTLRELLIPTRRWDAAMKKGLWSACHHLGSIALKDGRFHGILYPAQPARQFVDMPMKQNLALFMDPASPDMARPLHPAVRLRVIDRDGFLGGLKLEL